MIISYGQLSKYYEVTLLSNFHEVCYLTLVIIRIADRFVCLCDRCSCLRLWSGGVCRTRWRTIGIDLV